MTRRGRKATLVFWRIPLPPALCYGSPVSLEQQTELDDDAPMDEGDAPQTFMPYIQDPDESDEDYRLALIDQIAELDKTKRDIKAQIHSNAIRAKEERVSVDQVWLRRAKDKIDHLTREREEIRKVLHTVNERIKETRRAANRPATESRPTIDAAFRHVAREKLPPNLYDALLEEAHARLAAHKPPPAPPPIPDVSV